MTDKDIPFEYYGWWRIIETSQWNNDYIDIVGKALISITGDDDRLRMFVLLAYVNCRVTKTGVSYMERGLGVRPCQWNWERETQKGWSSLR
jgi:hypothetical protein